MAAVNGTGTATGTGVALGEGQVAHTWETYSSLPTGRSRAGLATYNGRTYLIGGRSSTSAVAGTIYVFDHATSTWSLSTAVMPAAKHKMFASHVGDGRIVWAGGIVGTSTESNTTTEWFPNLAIMQGRANAPVALGFGTQPPSGQNGKLYAISSLGVLYEFNAPFNTWTVKATLGTPRYYPVLAWGSDGLLHAIGGNISQTVHEAWNPTSNTWSTLAPMPTARGQAAGAVKGSLIFVVGGVVTAGSNGLAACEAYDCTTNTWTSKAAMPGNRLDGHCFIANGYLYHVGGTATVTGPPLFTMYRIPVPETYAVGVAIGHGVAIGGADGRGIAVGAGVASGDGTVANTNKIMRFGPIPIVSRRS